MLQIRLESLLPEPPILHEDTLHTVIQLLEVPAQHQVEIQDELVLLLEVPTEYVYDIHHPQSQLQQVHSLVDQLAGAQHNLGPGLLTGQLLTLLQVQAVLGDHPLADDGIQALGWFGPGLHSHPA